MGITNSVTQCYAKQIPYQSLITTGRVAISIREYDTVITADPIKAELLVKLHLHIWRTQLQKEIMFSLSSS